MMHTEPLEPHSKHHFPGVVSSPGSVPPSPGTEIRVKTRQEGQLDWPPPAVFADAELCGSQSIFDAVGVGTAFLLRKTWAWSGPAAHWLLPSTLHSGTWAVLRMAASRRGGDPGCSRLLEHFIFYVKFLGTDGVI